MATQVSHLPHIYNVKAGMEKYDPMHSSIFIVSFSVPNIMAGEYNSDEMILLSQQVTAVDGLDNLQKNVQMYTQKYLGVEVAFFNPYIENTGIDYNVTFNLNLRKVSDAYAFKIFKEWQRLMYNISTGAVALKQQCTGSMVILEANRDGTIWRQIVLKNVIVTDVKGLNNLDYTASDPRMLNVSFHADYWDETIG